MGAEEWCDALVLGFESGRVLGFDNESESVYGSGRVVEL